MKRRWCWAGAVGLLAAAPGSAAATTQSFTTDGNFTVPSGVTSVSIDALGAKGGDQTESDIRAGGAGGGATGTVSVIQGETLSVIVGGEGGDNDGSNGGAGGSGGGGDGGSVGVSTLGGAGGGGRSEVDRGLVQLVVAGGGGGSSFLGHVSLFADGGPGGGLIGLPAMDARRDHVSGGTQTEGGLAGQGDFDGAPGKKDEGGDAGLGAEQIGGGGGGGGFYGGGGGGSSDTGAVVSWSGGGGGSGHLDPSVQNGTLSTGVNRGAGKVTITYSEPAASSSTTTAGSSGGAASGASAPPPLAPPPLVVAPTEPSNAFNFARVRVGVHQLRLGFDYPGSGTLDVLVSTRRPRAASAASLRPGPRSVRVGRLHDRADRPETHTLRVAIGHRGKGILARRGKLPVRVSLVFTPDGGQSSRQARAFTVRSG